MAQIDANATKEQLAQMEREFARKRASAERRRAHELARLSEERIVVDAQGTSWSYVVVDESFVRIVACATTERDLVVPENLAELPVRELGTEALSYLAAPHTITCADGIEAIGAYAFRGCENLERLVLPANASAFSASYIALCPNLRDMTLPGSLETIPPDVVSSPSVERLVIGRGTRYVQPGAFEKSQLICVLVDEGNPYLRTDGTCLYTTDGTELIARVVKAATYDVAPTCRRIGPKAFSNARELTRITLNASLIEIGAFAFAYSGIESLACPPNLERIDEKACLHCMSLQRVDLNEGLEHIGDEAFAHSALPALHLPASVCSIGSKITERSRVRHAEPDATFSINDANEAYFCDAEGGLYHREPDGVHLVRFLEPHAASYQVKEGTIAIDEKAFIQRDELEEVVLPEGLARIGDGAFRVCRRLRCVAVPDSLTSVGKDAFIDTALERFRIPAGLTDIGPCALVTSGAHHEGEPPALRTIDLDPRNPRFFLHTGMLCRRTNTGANVVMFTNAANRVDFPDDIEEVEDYAFNNAFGIDELRLNARLRTIGACGLSVWCAIKHVHIDVAKPIEGRSSFVLNFPDTSHAAHGFLLALGGLGHLYLPDIMAQYDNCIASARDYHTPNNSDNASAYEQVKLIIGRLSDAVLLTDANRRRYCDLLERNIEEICVDIARHDDRKAIAQLADLGFLNESNLERVTVAVARLQDAAMTGYLLELKRLRFNRRAIDFDL